MAKVPPDRKAEVWRRDGYRCHYCSRAVEHPTGTLWDGMATVDHVIPRSKGGSNRKSNLVTACFRCNQSRGNNQRWDGSWKQKRPAVALRDGFR